MWLGGNDGDDVVGADKIVLFILLEEAVLVVLFVGPVCQTVCWPRRFPPIVLVCVAACWWPGFGWVQVALVCVGPTRKPCVQQ